MTCDQCRWKVERHECPWEYLYEGDDYAEDCTDFRHIEWEWHAFKDNEAARRNKVISDIEELRSGEPL